MLAAAAGVVCGVFSAYVLCYSLGLSVLVILGWATYYFARARSSAGMERDVGASPAGPSSRRRNIVMTCVAVAAFLLASVGTSTAIDYMLHSSSSLDHSYAVTVESTSAESYTVMCPVPCDEGGATYGRFAEELRVVEGSAQVSLVESEHGLALRILGTGGVKVEWDASWSIDGERFLNMTMTSGLSSNQTEEGWSEDVTAYSWVYASSSGMSVKLSYASLTADRTHPPMMSGGGPVYYFYEDLQEPGWGTVGVIYEWVFVG